MQNTYLGIDLGTSAMKMVLIDANKNVLKQVTEEYQAAKLSDGWCEIDPEIWSECMKTGILKLLKDQDRSRVKGIGVTGQMHTLITLGEDGKPARPAIMWNDTRTKELIPELKKTICKFYSGEYLSRTISTGSPAADLYWMKQNEPETLKKVKKFLIGPDYLVYCLTGKTGTDYCEASTSCLYEIEDRRWSREMQELIGLPDDVYPEIRGSAQSVGCITAEMAEILGLDASVQVIAGTGDNPATAISTGCMSKGYPVISLGTSGVFMMPIKKLERQAKGKKILFSFDNEEFSYLVQGVVQCNGNTFDWWNKQIMDLKDFERLTVSLDTEKMAESSLIFYPHLSGDKTIYSDPDMRGAFIGLEMGTDIDEMFYSVIEGLCFGFRELAEKMKLPLEKFGSVKVVGGGAKSPVWMQTMANVLNVRVEKLEGMIGPAFGIALLAAYNGGDITSLEDIAEGNVRVENIFEPNKKSVELCDKKYEKYLRVRQAMKYIEAGL